VQNYLKPLCTFNNLETLKVSLDTGALGNVRVTTLKAFALDETRKIIGELK
jgi:uncharacterized protein with GYD domain